MNRRRLIALGAALASPFMLAANGANNERVQADSPPAYYEGTYASGAIVKGKECPVVVEKQSLTLNIAPLPSVADKGSLSLCAGEAEINYLFYNPDSTAYKMTLLSPYGARPSYLGEGTEDVPFYSYVGESSAEGNIRHTYPTREFSIHEDSERVCDEKKTGFCLPDSVITEYTYSLRTPDIDGEYYLLLKFPVNCRKTHVFFEKEGRTQLCLENGNTLFKVMLDGASREKQVKFYVAGEPVKVQSATLLKGKYQTDYQVEEPAVGTLTFQELAMKGYSAASGVKETDWYNAFFDMLQERADKNGSVLGITLRPERFMRWYEYEVEVPANGYAENTVKVPIYPTVEGEKNPRYEYGFLLSAAEKWSNVRNLEIKINTPYSLTYSSLDFPEPEKKDGVYAYALTREYLPQGELTFWLAGTEDAETGYDSFDNKKFSSPSWNWAFITLIALTAVAAGVAVAVVISLRSKKKK